MVWMTTRSVRRRAAKTMIASPVIRGNSVLLSESENFIPHIQMIFNLYILSNIFYNIIIISTILSSIRFCYFIYVNLWAVKTPKLTPLQLPFPKSWPPLLLKSNVSLRPSEGSIINTTNWSPTMCKLHWELRNLTEAMSTFSRKCSMTLKKPLIQKQKTYKSSLCFSMNITRITIPTSSRKERNSLACN